MIRKRRDLCLLRVAGALLLAASQALAQSAAGSSVGSTENELILFKEIPSVYAASGFGQRVTQAPSSVTIVTSEEIRKYGYRTLADILRGVRGFFVTYDRNYTYLGARGFGRPGDYNSRILLLLDGHRMNENVYEGAALGTDAIIDVDLIDRVEIVRGPTSSLYGTNAIFGVVNVITRRGRDMKSAEAAAEFSSYDTFKGRASYGNRFSSGLEMLISGTVYDSAGPRLYFEDFDRPPASDGVVEKGDFDRSRSWLGKVAFRDFTIFGAHVSRKKGIPTGAYGTVFDDARNHTVDERSFVELRYERHFRERWEGLARVFYDRNRYHGDYVYETDAMPEIESRAVNRDFSYGSWWGAELKLTRSLAERHKLTLGTVYRRNTAQSQGYEFDLGERFELGGGEQDHVWAAYAQDEYSVRSNLVLNAGLRYDHYDTFGGTMNPRVGMIYTPREKTILKLLYGTAFRAPNAYELYYHDAGVSQKANPDLHAETIRTWEGILEQYVGNSLRASASVFHYKLNDWVQLVTDPDDALLTFRNGDDIGAWGAELELSGKWTNGVEASSSYVYEKAYDHSTGTILTNSPAHLVTAHLSVPLVADRVFAGFEILGVGRRTTPHGGIARAYAIGNVTLWGRRLADRWELSASLYNLFDRRFGDPGSEEHRQATILQDGRSFRVRLQYEIR